MLRSTLALALLGCVLSACGKDDDGDHQDNRTKTRTPVATMVKTEGETAAGPGLSSDATAAANARSCSVGSGGQPLSLLEDVSYAATLYPIMQENCANCHRGDIENRQNSTNCFYLKDHVDNVVKRLENGIAAAAYKAANPTASDNDVRGLYPEDERPMPQFPRPPLTQAQIDLFKAWGTQVDQCTEPSDAPEPSELLPPAAYSSDEEETSSQNLEKIFANAACEDGPPVNSEANWAAAMPLLAQEPNPTSAFYDFATKKYVAGATAAPYPCTFDGFIGSLKGLVGFEETLRQYEKYGWRLHQCAIVAGVPLASMISLSKVSNTLGDTILGINYKTITVDLGAPEAVK